MSSVGMNSGDYSAYFTQANSVGVADKISAVDKNNATNEEMMNACKEFEQYMVEQVYKHMEKTIIKADDEENRYMDYFNDFRIQAYAKMVSEQGNLGLADQLYQAMQRNSGADGVKE